MGPNKKLYIYLIDVILHELHLYEKCKETIEARNELLNNAGIRILLSPFRHAYMDKSASTFEVLAHLEKKESEKLAILEYLKAQHELSSEVKEKLSELQKDFLVASLGCIGFPSLIYWICKQSRVEKLEKYFNIHSKR